VSHVPVNVTNPVELLEEERADRAVERDAIAVLKDGLFFFGVVQRELGVDCAVDGRDKNDEAGEREEAGEDEKTA